jgi:hypothetical protein
MAANISTNTSVTSLPDSFPRLAYLIVILLAVFWWLVAGRAGWLRPREFVRLVGVGALGPPGEPRSEVTWYLWVPVDARPGPGSYWKPVELWQLTAEQRKRIWETQSP